MAAKRLVSGSCLFISATILLSACKKLPTTATINFGENTILVACNPASGGPDTTIAVAVLIAENSREVRVFGLEMSFDPDIFQYKEIASGNLTGGWTAVDANEISPGRLRIGGFAGGGSAISTGSKGALALVRLKVTAGNPSTNLGSQICVNHFTDDLSRFQPTPACTIFALKK
ncbi:MAG: cohesin domain-containing protein [Clostridiales bacterium]|nr:cohesin domain-containing protein [Clostridiales bacterium]